MFYVTFHKKGVLIKSKKKNATLVRELNLGARVAVTMKDGTTYSGFLEAPKGDPANPMSFDEIKEKFRNNARAAISEKIWKQ
jgi:2-methylcitrate dehydratase PrpD